MQNALKCCRSRQTSFTGLLNQLIARALHAELGPEHASKVFATQIVVDLRCLFAGKFSGETMMKCVSAYYETIASRPVIHEEWTTPTSGIWAAAHNTTVGLVKKASALHNQPIGLLQYLRIFAPGHCVNRKTARSLERNQQTCRIRSSSPVLRRETQSFSRSRPHREDGIRSTRSCCRAASQFHFGDYPRRSACHVGNVAGGCSRSRGRGTRGCFCKGSLLAYRLRIGVKQYLAN